MLDLRQILAAVIKEVTFVGWQKEALRSASIALGKESEYLNLHYSVAELFLLYNEFLDQQVLENYHKSGVNGIGRSITFCIKEKLRLLDGKVTIFMKFGIVPWHYKDMALATWQTSDRFWRAVGDQSLDWRYYSKRTSLGAIYTSCLLYAQAADDIEDVMQFVDRQITRWQNIIKKVV